MIARKRLDLTDDLSQIFYTKYAAPQISQLTPMELTKAVRMLVLKISVITGWNVSEQQEVRNILYEQTEKKLLEDYPDLNTEEIEYAVRAFGTTVKDWGKNINLSLLDEVLIPYKSKRLELSQLEERKAKPLPAAMQIEPIADENEIVETAKKIFLKTGKPGLISSKVYDILEKRGDLKLTNDQKKHVRNQVEARLRRETAEGDEQLKRLSPRDLEITVRNQCKSQAAANHFNLKNE